MKKGLKWIIIILAILLIGTIIFFIVTQKEKYFNEFDFNEKHIVYNMTSINYLDTIIHAGLQSVNVDDIIVIIKPLENNTSTSIPDNMELKAHIISNGVQYVIYIDKISRKQSISVLSHELIHLVQYYNKDLVIKSDSIMWKNKLVNLSSIEYKNRPWEIEAFYEQYDLEIEMKNILY